MALSAPFPAGFGTLLEGTAQGKGSISGGSALGKDAFPALCVKLLAEACLPACLPVWVEGVYGGGGCKQGRRGGKRDCVGRA